MSSAETGQMSAVETGQMTAAETSVLSQQKTSVPAQCCPRLLLAAAACPRLTQTMKSQTLINFSQKNRRCFLSNSIFPSTLRGVFEGDINTVCIFTRNSGCPEFAGSHNNQPPLHQTVRTPQLKLFGKKNLLPIAK